MSESIIPPSPSWYLSNILSCSEDGKTVAYGAKHELVVIHVSDPHKRLGDLNSTFIPMAHKDKVSAVAFPPSSGDKLYKDNIVSCSDDGTVRVWNYRTNMLIFSHSGHPEGHKVPSVDWSKADPNLIVSISDMGSIISWDLTSNTIRRLYAGSKVLPLSLACNPHNKDVIAIGAKAGLVVIFNIKGEGNVVFRMRGHETDVVSLSFCPVPYNIFKPNTSGNVHLLASGSKDRIIYFWKTGTDGRFETSLTLPSHPLSGQRSKNGLVTSSGAWVCVRWSEENTLLMSSLFGELLSCDLRNLVNSTKGNDGTKKKIKIDVIHSNHGKGLFSIGVTKPLENAPDDIIVWTSALDKHLICSKAKGGEILHNLSTIGGIVYCIAVSPIDHNRLAIGTGDNKINIWNLSNSTSEGMLTFWNKINSKVMAIAWHPSVENLLAFGTGEGRVGLLDVSNNKPPTLLRLHHRKSVYSLIWAPPILPVSGGDENRLVLFSVGDGDILQYDTTHPEKEPDSLDDILKPCDLTSGVTKALNRTDLSWNYDRSMAAIGNENGCLYIVEGKSFKHIHSVFAHQKLVQCVAWHPGTVTLESSLSPYSSWIATASDNIRVINITESEVTTVATFTEHSEKVVSLMWSPHINGRLVTASYDYTSQVWDVINGTMLSKFVDHHGAVVCCLFSPVQPDRVITGAADYTIRLWDVVKHSSNSSLPAKNKKQRMIDASKKFENTQEATDLNPHDGSEFKAVSVAKSEKNLEKSESNSKRRTKSMFPVTSTSLAQAKHLESLWLREKGEGPPSPENQNSIQETCYLDFFGDDKAIKRLLLVEESHHLNSGNVQNAMHASLWTGEISDVIKEASRKKQLNDWLVSLAPLVSYRLWVECSTNYAKQLIEMGEGLKASSYLLAVHKVEEAVDALIEAKLPREAVALAKSRFPPDDPTVVKAMKSWSYYSFQTGQTVLAAHCLLSIGEKMEAVEMLSRSKDASVLSIASRIAAETNSSKLAVTLALRSLNGFLIKSDYTSALTTISYHPSLKLLKLWVITCETLKCWPHKLDQDLAIAWLNGDYKMDASLYMSIVDVFKGEDIDGKEALETILKNTPSSPDNTNNDTIWLYISGQITLSVLSHVYHTETQDSLKYLIKALNASYSYQIFHALNTQVYLQLAPWIAPNGPSGKVNLFKSNSEPLLDSFYAHISCAGVYWIENLLSKSVAVSDECTVSVVTRCSSLVFNKDFVTYYQNQELIKRIEVSVVAAKLGSLRTSSEGVGNVGGLPGDESRGVADDSEANLEPGEVEKLAQLKDWNKLFEDKMCCCPNPFVIYFCISNLLKECTDSDSLKKLLDETNSLWQSISK